jgi:perosamine synthetase
MVDLGYNYRLTDIQSALGISQLKKNPGWLVQRKKIAERYDVFFKESQLARPLTVHADVSHAYHLYVVEIAERDEIFHLLRKNGIGVNVHYVPVHLHPYYRKKFNTGPGMCPHAERAYSRLMTLPMYPGLTQDLQTEVLNVLKQAVTG